MPKIAERREIDDLAERMLRVLESQRRLGGDAYPPTLERLAELSGVNPSNPNVLTAVNKKSFKDRAIVAWSQTKNEKDYRAQVPVFLAAGDGLDEVAAEVAPVVLVKLLGRAKETSTQALTVADLGKKVTARLQAPFKAAITKAIERRSLPPVVGSIKKGRSRLLFHLDAVETSAAHPPFGPNGRAGASPRADRGSAPDGSAPGASVLGGAPRIAEAGAADFAPAFREAFDRLDRANRSTNFVRLLDLRRAMPQFDRGRFDAGLRQLRLDDEFTLDSHEGRHGPLSDEEREAGIREAGSLLVYVSRRS